MRPTGPKFRPAANAVPVPSAGFVLIGSAAEVIACNAEAARILSYPDKSDRVAPLGRLLPREVRTKLLNLERSGRSCLVEEIRSGRRVYRCRAFLLDQQAEVDGGSRVAVLLERNPSSWTLLNEVTEQFRLTPREKQAAQFLLQGLASKEIAEHMQISPNTVKAFLRLIMIKMGASSRTGIIGKMVSARYEPE